MNKPTITNAYTDPIDVKPGDKMLVSADVSDEVGIRKVTADMPHEKGVDVNNNQYNPSDLRYLTNSPVLNTGTTDCSLKCGSLDQIGILSLDKDSAIYSVSSGSRIIDSASLSLCLNDSALIILISENTSSINSLTADSSKEDLGIISSMCSINSSFNFSGDNQSTPSINIIFGVEPLAIKTESSAVASITNSIYDNFGYIFLYRLCNDLFIFLPSSNASFSVNVLFDTICFTLSNASAFGISLDNSSLAISDQFTQGKLSISALNSSLTENVTLTIYIAPLDCNSSNFINLSNLFLSLLLSTSDQFTSGSESILSLSSFGIDNVSLAILSPRHNVVNERKNVHIYKSFGNQRFPNGLEKQSFSKTFDSKPEITNVYTDPIDVRPGDSMLVSADVKDEVGVEKVEVEMPHEKGVDVLEMGLVEGDKFDGTWQTIWNVHDTLEKNYTSVIRAENEEGIISEEEVEWSDSLTEDDTEDEYGCTGSWSGGSPCANVVDENWGTAGQSGPGASDIYINYTKPSGAVNATWEVKDNGGTVNLTVLSTCLDYSASKLLLRAENIAVPPSGPFSVKWYCYDDSWQQLRSDSGPNAYEEKIWWNISESITYTEFSGNGETTDLSSVGTDNTNVSVILDDGADGKIKFNINVSLNSSMNLDTAVQIDYASIMVNATMYPSLNVSANLTMNNLQMGYPAIYKDGVECSDCAILSWDTNTGEVTFSVSSFSEYTASEANQSKIQNNGTTNTSFYLLLMVEKYNAGTWEHVTTVYNSTAPIQINNTAGTGNLIKLDSYFNGKFNTSQNATGNGTYRVYAAAMDNNSNVLMNLDGSYVNATYNFTIDTAKPGIDLHNPADSATLYSDDVNFNWTATDNIDTSLLCNITINGTVNVSSISSANGTAVNYTVYDFADGDYIWNVTCWDDAFNANTSLSRTFTVYIDVTPPAWRNNATNLTGDDKINYDRWFYVNWSDDVGLSHYIFSWNGTNGSWVNDSSVVMTGTVNESNVTKMINLSQGNTIGWRFYANDTKDNWNFTDVWTFLVNNTPPSSVNLSYPLNNTAITNTTPRFNWTNATDADEDTIYYDIFIYCLGGCSVDNRELYNLTSANYTPSPPLKYYQDDGYSYKWWVRSFDNISYGSNSSKFNFTISSSVIISLPTANVSFGTMNINQQNDTTDDKPLPIVIQNDGNCYINVNISVDSYLWSSVQSESSYFQYKIDNVSGKEGAFNSTSSATSWTNFTLDNATGIYQFNYSDGRDSAEVDINLTVPPIELPGNKESNILFTGYYVVMT